MKELTLSYPGVETVRFSNTAFPRGTNEGRKALMLAIDLDASQCIGEVLDRCGFERVLLSTVAALQSCIRKSGISVLVCEEVLLDGNYKEVLRVSRGVACHIPVVVFSRLADWDQYLEAMRLGAFDCLRYPFRTGELRWVVNRALQERGWSVPMKTSEAHADDCLACPSRHEIVDWATQNALQEK